MHIFFINTHVLAVSAPRYCNPVTGGEIGHVFADLFNNAGRAVAASSRKRNIVVIYRNAFHTGVICPFGTAAYC